MKQWQCIVCGYVYDEAVGDPEHGIAPGTRWEDIPEDWACPECGIAKADFEMVQLAASAAFSANYEERNDHEEHRYRHQG